MTEAEIALAREAVVCKHWEWLDGSLSYWDQAPEHGGNTIRFRASVGKPHNDPWFQPEKGRWRLVGPVFSDDATRGALLGLVRRAFNKPGIYVRRRHGLGDHRAWACFDDGEPLMGTHGDTFTGPTEAAALVAALKAAP